MFRTPDLRLCQNFPKVITYIYLFVVRLQYCNHMSISRWSQFNDGKVVQFRNVICIKKERMVPQWMGEAVYVLLRRFLYIMAISWVEEVETTPCYIRKTSRVLYLVCTELYLSIGLCLFDFQLKHSKMVQYHYYYLIILFEHVINFSWQEQVETTSTRPVNHISELKLYNKIIYDSLI